MGKAMYQSAFWSFENCLNSVVVGDALKQSIHFKNSPNIEGNILFQLNTVNNPRKEDILTTWVNRLKTAFCVQTYGSVKLPISPLIYAAATRKL